MGNQQIIYFDNAATTFHKPSSVIEAVKNSLIYFTANPKRGSHPLSFEVMKFVEKTRQKVAKFISVDDPDKIIFTKNATESINIIINGFLKEGKKVLISPWEHNAVTRPLTYWQQKGVSVHIIPTCLLHNETDINLLEDFIKKIHPDIIISTFVSNITGAIIPVEKIGFISKKHSIFFLVDATQAAGHIEINAKIINCDAIAFSGHKGLHGPMGIGILYIKNPELISPLIRGGTGSFSTDLTQPQTSPDKFEAGTLNVPGIAGISEAIDFISSKGIDNIRKHILKLATKITVELSKSQTYKIYSPYTDPLNWTGIILFNHKELRPDEIEYILAKHNIICRSGLHCAPLAHKSTETFPQGAVRISLSIFNTENEVDLLLDCLLSDTKIKR